MTTQLSPGEPIHGDLSTVLAELVDPPSSGEHQGQLCAVGAVVIDQLADRQPNQCRLIEHLCAQWLRRRLQKREGVEKTPTLAWI